MNNNNKLKVRQFLNEYPAIKTFGASGAFIIIVLFILSTVFSNEISRLWDDRIHPNKPIIASTEEKISSEVSAYTPGLYNNSNISFKYPENWIPSESSNGSVSVYGYQIHDGENVEYIFTVLNITSDTTMDIYEYISNNMTEKPVSGGMGSMSLEVIGNYSGVWTGCLYYDGDISDLEDEPDYKKFRSMNIIMLTDGKTRVYAEFKMPNLIEGESYNDEILNNILDSFVIK